MDDTVTAIHMVNGAIIVGVVLEDDKSLVIKNPLNLLVQQSNNGVSMGFAPMGFPFYEKPKEQPETFTINKAAVAYTHVLKGTKFDDIIKSYKQTFSSIILGTGVSLNLGK